MRNVLFEIGSLKVHSYGLMFAIGIIAAFIVTEKRASKYGLEEEKIFDLGIWCVIGGLLGSKLTYFIVEWDSVIKDPSMILNLSEGWVVYGGIIGGILGGFLYTKWKKFVFLKYFDLVMPSIALAQGFGRIGCFLAGCCYGRETDSSFGVVFHDSPFAPNGVKLIPTQLISSAFDFLLFFFLICMAAKVKKDGEIAGLYLIFYSVGRFLIEFLRNDDRGAVGMLSTSQFISCFVFATGIILLFVVKKYGTGCYGKQH